MPSIIPLPAPSPTPPGAIVRELTLDEIDVRIDIAWNARIARWSISLLDDAGSPVIAGKTLEVGVILNEHYTGSAWPRGALVAIREGEGEGTVGRNELGGAIKLAWYSALELADLVARIDNREDLTFSAL